MKHPVVEFIRYFSILAIACTTHNPVALVILLLGSLVLLWNKIKTVFISNVMLIGLSLAVNVLTNHRGETYLFYLNDNIVTLESFVYGLVLGTQIAVLVNLCMAMSKKFTSEKVVIITSYLSPSLALLISMGIRSVNKYSVKLKEIYCYQKTESSSDRWLNKLLISIRTVSILITWALENGIETSDSMRCRGYGSGRRTSYSPIQINWCDILEGFVLILGLVVVLLTMPDVIIQPYIQIGFSLVNTGLVIVFTGYSVWEDKYGDKN